MGVAIVTDGSAGSPLRYFDALPSRNLSAGRPRAAGYRGSDFVRWHRPADFGGAEIQSAIGGLSDSISGRSLGAV
jgi:hypothetical protein